MTGRAPRAVVIGGGIAGLVAAWELVRAGRSTVLLERGERIGGSVGRHSVAGIELDSGAESFATARPDVADLVHELGMADRIRPPAALPAWLRHEDGSAPLPRAALLGIPGHPDADDVVAAIGPRAVQEALALDACPLGDIPRTLGELVAQRMGEQVLRRLVDPVVGGVYAADPTVLGIDGVTPGLRAALTRTGSLAAAVRSLRGAAAPGSAVAGIAGGMAELPRELGEQLVASGGEIRCGATVLAIEGVVGERAVVVRDRAGRRSVEAAEKVVIACPAGDLLRGTVSDDLTGERAVTTPVLLRTLVVDDPRLDAAPRGTGVLVSRSVVDVQAKALTHVSVKWPWLAARLPPGRHVLRLSYGRGGAVADPPPTAVLRDASRLLGIELRDSDVVASAAVRWPSALPQGRAGRIERTRALRSALPDDLLLVGEEVAGNGLSSVVADTRAELARCNERHSDPGNRRTGDG